MLVTAAFGLWSTHLGVVLGALLHYAFQYDTVKLQGIALQPQKHALA